jgi:hypothetical protein
MRDRIILAIQKVIEGHLGTTLQVSATYIQPHQHNIEGGAPPLGNLNHANTYDVCISFPLTKHFVKFQLSSRQEGWTPLDLVTNFWSSHMGVYIVRENGKFVGTLTADAMQVSRHFALLQPRCLLSAFCDFIPPPPPAPGGLSRHDAAASVLCDYLDVIASLTSSDSSGLRQIDGQTQENLSKKVIPAVLRPKSAVPAVPAVPNWDKWDPIVQSQ